MLPPVVDAAWLAEHRQAVVVADVRWYLDGRSGRAAYEDGHLPGAVFVDLEQHLTRSGEPQEGRHPLPTPEAFAASLGALGIGDDDAVVAYDDAGGAVAGRLVWMLRATGRDGALLDGGLAAWDGALGTDEHPRAAATATARPWPADRLAALEEVGTGGGPLLLDARAAVRYRGDVEPVDPRAGHVPGAVSLPATDLLDENGRLLPPEQLRQRFAAVGATAPDVDVVASCGSGITACLPLLALEHAGLPPGRLLPGSFSAWASTPGLPVATGDEPG